MKGKKRIKKKKTVTFNITLVAIYIVINIILILKIVKNSKFNSFKFVTLLQLISQFIGISLNRRIKVRLLEADYYFSNLLIRT